MKISLLPYFQATRKSGITGSALVFQHITKNHSSASKEPISGTTHANIKVVKDLPNAGNLSTPKVASLIYDVY